MAFALVTFKILAGMRPYTTSSSTSPCCGSRMWTTVKVVNDSCERAIALAKDYYAILTKDSRVRRMICQVVEQDRREFPDVSKKTLGKR